MLPGPGRRKQLALGRTTCFWEEEQLIASAPSRARVARLSELATCVGIAPATSCIKYVSVSASGGYPTGNGVGCHSQTASTVLNTVCRLPLQAGLPHLMDPVSLDTLSESRMGGQITTNTFAAHYRIMDEGVEVDRDQQQQQQQPQPVEHQQADGLTLGEMWMRHHANAHGHTRTHAARAEVRPGPQSHSHVSADAPTHHMYQGAAAPSGHTGHQPQYHHHPGQAQQQQEFRRHHRDGSGRQRLVTFSNEFSFTGARAVFYEFDEDGRLLHRQEHMLEVGRRGGRGRAGPRTHMHTERHRRQMRQPVSAQRRSGWPVWPGASSIAHL